MPVRSARSTVRLVGLSGTIVVDAAGNDPPQESSLSHGHSLTLATPVPDSLVGVREALAGGGFGIVSEVEIAAALKNKLGVEIEPSIGLLLPGNVVVRFAGDVGAHLAAVMEVLRAGA